MTELKNKWIKFYGHHSRGILIAIVVVLSGWFVVSGLMQIPTIKENEAKIAEYNAKTEDEKNRQTEIDDLTTKVNTDEFIEKMHRDGKLVWMNSIVYDRKDQICGGHSDDTALTESEDKGWGWIADKNVDFIQTDWTMMLIDYLKRTDKYLKKEK